MQTFVDGKPGLKNYMVITVVMAMARGRNMGTFVKGILLAVKSAEIKIYVP